MRRRLLFLTMMFAAGIWGCSDKGPVQEIPEEGAPTYMSVSLIFPKLGQDTRTVNDPNATNEEVAIKSVHIFIYKEDGRFLSSQSLDVDLFSLVQGSEDRYRSTELIRTTTGKKFVYAGINLPASTVSALQNLPMSGVANQARTFSMADFNSPANGLPMFSVMPSAENFSPNPDDQGNHVSIKVKRLVAKITVEKSADMEQAGVPGILGPLEIAVNNFNTKVFLQQGEAPQCKDPNWTFADYDPSDFVDTPTEDYVLAHDLALNPNPAISDYNALYATENTSETKLKKEITRVTVRSAFLPDEITVVDPTSADGYAQQPRPAGMVSPETFYTVTPNVREATRFFYDKAVAEQYAAEKGGSVVIYTDGMCYWDMYLNKNNGQNEWDVLRNDYYKCTITKIVAPGNDVPNVKNPDITPDSDADISMDINVLFWTPVLEDYILEP